MRSGWVAGAESLSRDTQFARLIATRGLRTAEHWYSRGVFRSMELLPGTRTMPRPIPVPVRLAAFRLWQRGRQTREIAAALRLVPSTVRRLLARFRALGEGGIEPSYHP